MKTNESQKKLMNHKFKVGDVIKSNGNSLHINTLQIKSIDEKGRYVTCCLGSDNTLKDSQKWIEENYELVISQMKEVIEVGDILHHTKMEKDYTVSAVNHRQSIQLEGYSGWNDAEWVAKYMTFKTKANKQEIIGYELLKDLPGIPAGTKSRTIYKDGTAIMEVGANNMAIAPLQLQDTTWFKPIYKAKEVVVKISKNREVQIKNEQLHINGQGSLGFLYFNSVRQFIINGNMIINGHSVTHKSVMIGCQEFTIEDIEAVHKAIIQNIK